MPMGPWPDFEACLVDPALVKRYPTRVQREKVCGAIKARLEASQAAAKLRGGHGDSEPFGGNVTETAAYWIIHDAVAAKEGVNDKGEFKPWDELVAAAASLEGVPLVYGDPRHPVDESGQPIVMLDPAQGVGYAVNVRAQADDHTLRFDALLLKQEPVGSDPQPGGVERNQSLADLVKGGGTAQVSVGYFIDPGRSGGPGVFDAKPYMELQRGITFGHVAILKPFSPYGGSCGPACAIGADAEEHACTGGEGCCKKRLAQATKDIMAATGASRLAALRIVADAVPR